MLKDLTNVGNNFLSAIFAGVAISMGCVAFLSVGGVMGSILFTFGLLTVVHYFAKLYTGTAGFVDGFFHKDSIDLLIILIGNVVGCVLFAWLISISDYNFDEPMRKLITMRTSLSNWGVFIRAIFCGLIMTAAVKFWRNDNPLVLLFGVPLFICSGFLHSIADAFYYAYHFITHDGITSECMVKWLITVVGNYCGCNLWRIFKLYI